MNVSLQRSSVHRLVFYAHPTYAIVSSSLKGKGKYGKGRYGKGKGKGSHGSSWYGAPAATAFRAATIDNRPTTIRVDRASCDLLPPGEALEVLRKHFGTSVKEATESDDAYLFKFKSRGAAEAAMKRGTFQSADLSLAWYYPPEASSGESHTFQVEETATSETPAPAQ